MGMKNLLQGLFRRSELAAYPTGSIAVPLGTAIMGRADVTRQRIDESLDVPEFKMPYLGLPTQPVTRVIPNISDREVWADLPTMPIRMKETLIDETLIRQIDPNATEAMAVP
jgi:hypothetical protein